MSRILLQAIIVVVFCGVALGVDSNISWISGDDLWDFSRFPENPTTIDSIGFTIPTDVFRNQRQAEQSLGGIPTLIIDSVQKRIDLQFEPPAPTDPLTEYDPVSGLQGYFGPLEEGSWLFFVQFPGTIYIDNFEVTVISPSPSPAQDFLTEQFVADGNAFDLTDKSVMFVPTQDGISYTAGIQQILQLPTDPAGGVNLGLADDASEFVKLSDSATVSIYGISFTGFYVGSNGYITFTEEDREYSDTLSNHFDLSRVSGLFRDLNPSSGGQVSWKQLADRAVVTWENVPEYGTNNSNTFQIALFFDGSIRISWLGIDAAQGIVGLSEGLGVPPDFQETDFSELPQLPTTLNYMVEQFTSGGDEFDLSLMSIMFTPTGDGTSYSGEVQQISKLPTDPIDGTTLALGDDDFEFVKLSNPIMVSIYGNSFKSFYVGSNGYVTFTEGDQEHSENLEKHFNRLRISGLFRDLDPSSGGQVSWKYMKDRVAITWQNVPEYNSSSPNTFQIEMFYDGNIRLSWLAIAAESGIVGLSDGAGVPPDFQETDLSELSTNPPPLPPLVDEYLTEEFANDDIFDLQYSSIMFTPTSDGASYIGSLQDITRLPTNPSGGKNLGLREDDYVLVGLSNQAQVKIFNQSFRSFFVGINGYITFATGDTDFSPTLEKHFEILRISGLYCDLSATYEGFVTAKQLVDRVAVTWDQVPEFSNTSPNTLQIEMFYDGRIRLSWLEIGSMNNIVGLSNGLGLSPDFQETDFSVRYAQQP